MFLMLWIGFLPAKATDVGIKEAVLSKIGFDRIVDFSQNTGFSDIKQIFQMLMSGEALSEDNHIAKFIKESLRDATDYIKTDIAGLMLPVLTGVFARVLIGKSGSYSGVLLICRMGSAITMASIFTGIRTVAFRLIEQVIGLTEAVSPVLISALGLTGAVTTASLISPMASMSTLGISWVFRNIGIRLIDAAVAVAISGNLSENFRLKQLFKLIKSVLLWSTGLMIAGFTALLSVQGLMGNSLDSITVRGIQYTAESLIPVIGGEVSDSMDSILASICAIKNAVGITGMILLIFVCAGPVVRLYVFGLSFRLAAAVMEPTADRCIGDTAIQFADLAKMLLVMCVGCMLMTVLLIGACISTAGKFAV